MTNDKRLIEDYLPIVAISAEASREKSVRKGHISTLHLWWARRPLVACRAAVYGALVPADRWVKEIELKNPPDDPAKAEALKNGKKLGLNRKAASDFVKRLCRYPSDTKPEERIDIDRAVKEAQQHILEAHAERLTEETGKKVTAHDIVAGKASRPKVLDMFAGGGAIPLEALRLGCEAYALDLNPVAHIIQLCTLVYPQKYGKPDPTERGMTGPENTKGETTWGGLADEVRYWGEWVLSKVKAEIGDLYPPIPDPEAKPAKGRKGENIFEEPQATMGFAADPQQRLKPKAGFLTPAAYLWTRTVTCKNPNCKATVPLVKQTWLCKKSDRCVALRMVAPRGKKQVRFEVVESRSESGLGFDPAAFSKAGNATCPFCGTVADSDYVKAEACAGRMGQQMMATICVKPGKDGKVYLAADDLPDYVPDDAKIRKRIESLCKKAGMSIPDEPIEANPRSMDTQHFGFKTWAELYSARQLLSLQCFSTVIHEAQKEIKHSVSSTEHLTAIATALGATVSRLANFCSTLCTWFYDGGRGVKHVFARQSLPMVWDYAETNPFNDRAASWVTCAEVVVAELDALVGSWHGGGKVLRGSATSLP